MCPQQIPEGMTWDCTWVSMVTGWGQTAWVMV